MTIPWAIVASMSCPSVTRCFAGGSYGGAVGLEGMLLTWTGKKWSVAKVPLPANATVNTESTVSGMSCLSVTWCTAVGQYYTPTNGYGLLLKWSGKKWTATAAPMGAILNAVSCPSVTLCFAGGSYSDSASHAQLLMLRWSGSKWAVVPVPLPSSGAATDPHAAISGVSCPSVTQCVAVGSYMDSAGNQQGVLLTWSGKNWTAAKAPLSAGAASNPWTFLNAVSCPASSRCTVGGEYQDAANQAIGLLLTWSGKGWKVAKAPAIAYGLYGMSCPSVARCFAVSWGLDNPVLLTGP